MSNYYDVNQFGDDLQDVLCSKFKIKTEWLDNTRLSVRPRRFDEWSLSLRHLIEYLGALCSDVFKVYDGRMLPYPHPSTGSAIRWLKDDNTILFSIGEVGVYLTR